MYSLKALKGNFEVFEGLNNRRLEFNCLNQDFFQAYNSAGFFKRFTLTKNVTLLSFENEVVGYVWINKIKNLSYSINSIYVDKEHEKEGYQYLLQNCPSGKIIYYCEIGNENFDLLSNIGFVKSEGTLKMFYDLNNFTGISSILGVNSEVFIKNKHEGIRCKLQNEIFKNKNRTPLSIEDIYGDEFQDYYLDYGSIFIKKNDEYIGYGQIIFEDSEPLIVNFGIIEGYRRQGFGVYLLQCLLKIAKARDFEKVYIKLDSNNYAAFQLYSSTGFTIHKQYYNLKLIK